jgi:hypothetical protein
MDEAFLTLIKQVGPIAALLLFFVYRDKQREERLGARLDQMQDRYANTMETIVKDNTKAMESSAETAKAATTGLASCTEALNKLREVVERMEERGNSCETETERRRRVG